MLIERTATQQRFIHRQRLVVIDHDLHRVAEAPAHRRKRSEIFTQRRITQTQLHGAKTAGQQLFGFVRQCRRWHQAETATVIGCHRFRRAAEEGRQRHTSRDRQRIPASGVECRHRHANDALHADQRITFVKRRPPQRRIKRAGGERSRRINQHGGNRCRGGAGITEQISAAGDAFFGFYVNQQQRRGTHRRRTGAQHIGHRHLDGTGPHRTQRQPWLRLRHHYFFAPAACSASTSHTARLQGVATPTVAPSVTTPPPSHATSSGLPCSKS